MIDPKLVERLTKARDAFCFVTPMREGGTRVSIHPTRAAEHATSIDAAMAALELASKREAELVAEVARLTAALSAANEKLAQIETERAVTMSAADRVLARFPGPGVTVSTKHLQVAGLSRKQFFNALTYLSANGKIRRFGYGLYRRNAARSRSTGESS